MGACVVRAAEGDWAGQANTGQARLAECAQPTNALDANLHSLHDDGQFTPRPPAYR